MSEGPSDTGYRRALRRAARLAVAVGAAGSVALTLYAGRHNDSRILRFLFAAWVVSPFLAAGTADLVSKHWSALTRATLHIVTLVLTPASLAVYAATAFGRTAMKTGSVFLVGPLACWLLPAVAVPIAAVISGRRTDAVIGRG